MEAPIFDVETLSDIRYSLCIKEKVILADQEKKTYTFDAVSGKIIASVMFRLEVPGMEKNIMTLRSSEGQKAVSIGTEGMAVFAYGGKIRKKIYRCKAGSWFSVRVSLDTNSHTYQVFVDGEKCLTDASFFDDAGDIASYETYSRKDSFMEKLIFVYRNPVQSVVAASCGKKIYDAKNLGIEADGSTVVTEKLQKLIDTCSAQGGGIIYLKSGTYLSGMLKFKKGTQLYLETDATLKGVLDICAYPPRNNSNWNMFHYGPQMALIYAENVDDFVIEGGGTIDGSGHFAGDYGSESERPSAVLLFECNNVKIRDVYVKDSGMWTMPMVNCSKLYFRDVNLCSYWFPNRDGIDFCDSSDALIENCSFISDDDTICFKSGSERGCDNIHVRNMMIISVMANAVKFGTGSYGKFTNCRVSDCIIKDTRLGAICVESVDGAEISNLDFERLEIKDAGAAFFIVLGDRGSVPTSGIRRIGSIDGVRFKDISVENITKDYGCYISGLEKDGTVYRLKHIAFDNVRACYQGGVSAQPELPGEYDDRYPEVDMFRELPASCYFVRHAENVTFVHCQTDVAKEDVRDKIVAVDADLHYPTTSC